MSDDDPAGDPPGGDCAAPLMLYDGACGFCAAAIRFVLRHEHQRTLRFAALDGALGRQIRERHPEMGSADSMMIVEHPGQPNEHVGIRSAAALRIAGYMGGPWRLARLAMLVPRPLRDGLYDIIARHRQQLPGNANYCDMPPPAVQRRFIDRPPR